MNQALLREHARQIWDAGVAAADPRRLVVEALAGPLGHELRQARRILVLGGGKAGAAMAHGVEQALADCSERIDGWLNVPEGSASQPKRICLHPARPQGSNYPTDAGALGSERMLHLAVNAAPEDVALVLISGGGSALMPAPEEGISLSDKQAVTRALHGCGATINELNCVRKHLSRIKGGGLASAFRGRRMVALIISDVVGDPLDVIASGPTAPDPSTFADALSVLDRYGLRAGAPDSVISRLEAGAVGKVPETMKSLPPSIENRIVGSNSISLRAAQAAAEALGYRVLNLGSMIEGETREVATALAGLTRSVCREATPLCPPACILLGGETTVTLGPNPGKGGRNMEFTLAFLHKLGEAGMERVVVLSGGTDGEDGPTDAAGAIADVEIARRSRGMNLNEYLTAHNAYQFFERTGGLLKTGLTGTNVMDIRIVLAS